jgi:hypothetical protein
MNKVEQQPLSNISDNCKAYVMFYHVSDTISMVVL